jgi:hypothetical protein
MNVQILLESQFSPGQFLKPYGAQESPGDLELAQTGIPQGEPQESAFQVPLRSGQRELFNKQRK